MIKTAGVLDQYGLISDGEAIQYAAISAMVTAVDPLGRVFSDEDLKTFHEAQKGLVMAVGIRITCTNHLPFITEVLPDTPAADAGLLVGDIIQSIDDQDAHDLPHTMAIALLRGPAEESVHLAVHRGQSEELEWDITRSLISSPSVQVAEILPGGFGYIKLNGLYESGCGEILDHFREWEAEHMPGAVLDLRGAGGSCIHSITDIASAFADAGSLLFSLRDKKDDRLEEYKARAVENITLPLMILIDEETSGAAETLAAIFKGSTRGAMLLGRSSKGNFTIRENIPIAGKYNAYIATHLFAVADGTLYSGDRGVSPDIIVKAPVISFKAEVLTAPKVDEPDEDKQHRLLRQRVVGDPALRRATDLLLGLKALNIRNGAGTENTQP